MRIKMEKMRVLMLMLIKMDKNADADADVDLPWERAWMRVTRARQMKANSPRTKDGRTLIIMHFGFNDDEYIDD